MEASLQTFYEYLEVGTETDVQSYFNNKSHVVIDGYVGVGREMCAKALIELYKDDELYTQKIGFHNNAALTVGQTYKNGRIVEGSKYATTFDFDWNKLDRNAGFVMSYFMFRHIKMKEISVIKTELQKFYDFLERKDEKSVQAYFNDQSYVFIDGELKGYGKKTCAEKLIDFYANSRIYTQDVDLVEDIALVHGFIHNHRE